jgi:hypothetical protein
MNQYVPVQLGHVRHERMLYEPFVFDLKIVHNNLMGVDYIQLYCDHKMLISMVHQIQNMLMVMQTEHLELKRKPSIYINKI